MAIELKHESETGERRSKEETCAWSVLCQEDKDQLDRIERLLIEIRFSDNE